MGTGRDESLCLVWAAGRATAAAVRANAASECVAALATAVKPMGSPPILHTHFLVRSSNGGYSLSCLACCQGDVCRAQ